MAFRSAADGVAKKGRTKGKNLGDSGPTVGVQNGGKKTAGVKNTDLKKMGRGLSKVAAQKRG
jgi:hypothetical protein